MNTKNAKNAKNQIKGRRFRAAIGAETQEQLLECLKPGVNEPFVVGDRMVKGQIIRTHDKKLVRDSVYATHRDDAHEPFVVADAKGGAILVCGDDTLRRLSPMEALLLQGGCMQVNFLDFKYNSHQQRG
jgi:hypothetical protein